MKQELAQSGVIYCPEYLNSFSIYSQVLPELKEHYIQNNLSPKCNPPTLSLKKVKRITSDAIVLLIGIGITLKDYHNQIPIKIDFGYTPHLTPYLFSTRFISIIAEKKIFSFQRAEIAGDPGESKKEVKKYHRIIDFPCLPTEPDFYDQGEDILFRRKLNQTNDTYFRILPIIFDRYEDDLINQYGKIYFEQNLKPRVMCFKKVICEIIVNCRIHSKSEGFIIGQFKPSGTKLCFSIVDFGIGLTESLNKQAGRFQKLGIDLRSFLKTLQKNPRAEEFLVIMKTLEIARLQSIKNDSHYNLFTLIRDVHKLRGTFRIHYNSTQIIFTPFRCTNCCKYEQSFAHCYNCLINDYKEDLALSPLRLYNETLRGVHIEIELPVEPRAPQN